MADTPAAIPAPIEDLEHIVADAAPSAVRPEVQQVEADLNQAFTDAADKAPEAGAEAAAAEPGVGELAGAASTLAHGGTVSPTVVVNAVEHSLKEVKAGYKTTEFWGTAAIIVLAQLGTLNLPGKYGQTITTVAAAAAYTISRGLAKLHGGTPVRTVSKQTQTNDEGR